MAIPKHKTLNYKLEQGLRRYGDLRVVVTVMPVEDAIENPEFAGFALATMTRVIEAAEKGTAHILCFGCKCQFRNGNPPLGFALVQWPRLTDAGFAALLCDHCCASPNAAMIHGMGRDFAVKPESVTIAAAPGHA